MTPIAVACGNRSEYITHGSPERVGVTCALPRFHANRYHSTADGRHEWHVDDQHWIAALADRDAQVEMLIAALRDTRHYVTGEQLAVIDALLPAIPHDPDPVEPDTMRAIGVTICRTCGEKLRLWGGEWEHFGVGKPFESMEVVGR